MTTDESSTSDPPSPQLQVTVLHRPEVADVETAFFADFVCQVAEARDFDHGEVTVVVAGDEEVQALNRRYRGQDRVTDILSFPGDNASKPGLLCGDMIIAAGKAQRQAAQRHHSLATEFRYLLIHGTLHLMGLDHEVDDGQMNAEEERVRGRLLAAVGGRPLQVEGADR